MPRLVTAAALLFACAAVAQVEITGRRGEIQYSNGDSVEGMISTPGDKLQVHDGENPRWISLAQIREFRFTPEKEEMEQKWRFPEVGQTRKEKYGQPYPTRHLTAAVVMSDGETINGHIFTAPLYIESEKETQKVVLFAKQRGQEGQTLQDLVYPVRISFKDTATEQTRGDVRLTLAAGAERDIEVAAMVQSGLVRLEARRDGRTDAFVVPAPLAADLFLAVRTGAVIYAGWPLPVDAALKDRIETALKDVRDFFDARKLLAVYQDASSGDIFSLLLLSRKGETTLGGAQTQPWRLGIWRWKENDEHRLMLAGQNVLFRGILEKGIAPPAVRLSKTLWRADLQTGAPVQLE